MPQSQLLLLSGMPRSGSTWLLRLLNELCVARGGQDYTVIRTQYRLEKYISVGSALIDLSLPRLLPILRPLVGGQSFAVKSHTSPKGLTLGYLSDRLLRYLAASDHLLTIYLYRDPRDAVLSGYEYVQRTRQNNRPNAFDGIFDTIDMGIIWMERYLRVDYRYWLDFPDALVLRYEDLTTNFDVESERILRHLGVEPQSDLVQAALLKYQPGATPQVGTHFHKGEIGRFRQEFTPDQQQRCNLSFSSYLSDMGYSLDEPGARKNEKKDGSEEDP